MLVESTARFFSPHQIQFNEAIVVAIIGLTVNLVSALLLKDHHGHSHSHSHGHSHSHHNHQDHAHQGQDHNLRAAYLHVLADALTSILAIAALLFGKWYGLTWLDPLMGIVGSIIITRWAWQLLGQTSPILLDQSIEEEYRNKMTALIESEEDHQVTDLHIWKISADHYAAAISIVSHQPKEIDYFKEKLGTFTQVSHLTIELNTCHETKCHQHRVNQ